MFHHFTSRFHLARKTTRLSFDELQTAATLMEQCSSTKGSSSSSSSSKTCAQVWSNFISSSSTSSSLTNSNSSSTSTTTSSSVPFAPSTLPGENAIENYRCNILFGTADLLRKSGDWSLALELVSSAHWSFNHLKKKQEVQEYYRRYLKEATTTTSGDTQEKTESSCKAEEIQTAGESEKKNDQNKTFSSSQEQKNDADNDTASSSLIDDLIQAARSILNEQERSDYQFFSKMKLSSSSQNDDDQLSDAEIVRRTQGFKRERRQRYDSFSQIYAAALEEISSLHSTKEGQTLMSMKRNFATGRNKNDAVGNVDHHHKTLLQLISLSCKCQILQDNFQQHQQQEQVMTNSSSSMSSSSIWVKDSEWPMLALDSAVVRLLMENIDLVGMCIMKGVARERRLLRSQPKHNGVLANSLNSLEEFIMRSPHSSMYVMSSEGNQTNNNDENNDHFIDLQNFALLLFRAFVVEADLASTLVHQARDSSEVLVVLELIISHLLIVKKSSQKISRNWNELEAHELYGLHHHTSDGTASSSNVNRRLFEIVRNIHLFNYDSRLSSSNAPKSKNTNVQVLKTKEHYSSSVSSSPATTSSMILLLWPFFTRLLDSILTDSRQQFARLDRRRNLMVEDWMSDFGHVKAAESEEDTIKYLLSNHLTLFIWETICSAISNNSSDETSLSSISASLSAARQAALPAIRKAVDLVVALPKVQDHFSTLTPFIFAVTAGLGLDLHSSNLSLLLARHGMFAVDSNHHHENNNNISFDKRFRNQILMNDDADANSEPTSHKQHSSKLLLELIEEMNFCFHQQPFSSFSKHDWEIFRAQKRKIIKRWLANNSITNEADGQNCFSVFPPLGASFYKIVFEGLMKTHQQTCTTSNDDEHSTNEHEPTKMIIKPERAGFKKRSPTKVTTSTTINPLPSYSSFQPSWSRVLKIISSAKDNFSSQKTSSSSSLFSFTQQHQQAAFMACADVKQWAVGLMIYDKTRFTIPSPTHLSVPIVLDFMRRMPAFALTRIHNHDHQQQHNNSSTSNNSNDNINDKQNTNYVVKPWREAINLVFTAYNYHMTNSFMTVKTKPVSSTNLQQQTNYQKQSSTTAASATTLMMSRPHPIVLSRLCEIVANKNNQFKRSDAASWEEVSMFFNLLMMSEHDLSIIISNSKEQQQQQQHESRSSSSSNNHQHLSFIKSCGPDSYAPLLSRLASFARWQEASLLASIMIQQRKLVHPSQLAPLVSNSGTNMYWREMLKNFTSAVHDGYLQPSIAVGAAASMTVTHFEKLQDQQSQEQNQQRSNENQQKLPSQVACVGVLYWMIQKQRVYPSMNHLIGSAETKNKVRDVVRGVCSENDSLQPERIVRKCFKELD